MCLNGVLDSWELDDDYALHEAVIVDLARHAANQDFATSSHDGIGHALRR